MGFMLTEEPGQIGFELDLARRRSVGEQEAYRRIVYSLGIVTVLIGLVFIYHIGYHGNIRVFTWHAYPVVSGR